MVILKKKNILLLAVTASGGFLWFGFWVSHSVITHVTLVLREQSPAMSLRVIMVLNYRYFKSIYL